MRRAQLKTLIREATRAISQAEVYVIGSQAIHAAVSDSEIPDSVARSREADMYPVRDDASGLVAGVLERELGVLSDFDEANGIFVDTVGPETASLPQGWQGRALRIAADGDPPAVGICPEPNDLCVSKLARSEEKDLEFVTEVVRLGLATVETIRERLEITDLERVGTRRRIEAYLDWLVRTGARGD